MNELRTALIAGATGLIGRNCLQALLDDPTYSKVTVVARREINRTHPKLVSICIQFDRLADLTQKSEMTDGAFDDVYCCLGTTIKTAGSRDAFYLVDYTYCFEFAKVAARLHARQFLLVSSLGANSKSGVYYSHVK